MQKRIISIIVIFSFLFVLTACSQTNKLKGTYTLESSGILGKLASATRTMKSITFKGEDVTIDVGKGVTLTGTFTFDGSTVIISLAEGVSELSGEVSSDKKTIKIATLKYTKE